VSKTDVAVSSLAHSTNVVSLRAKMLRSSLVESSVNQLSPLPTVLPVMILLRSIISSMFSSSVPARMNFEPAAAPHATDCAP
jgi:hypothetical protein